MNRILPIVIMILSCTAGTAHGQTIADARNAALGSAVTVNGIVTSGDALGTVRYVQDATGAIAAFPGTGSVPGFAPQAGDSITVTGTLTNYSGLLEITPITSFDVLASDLPLPSPQGISLNNLGENVEGKLVQVHTVQFLGTGNFTPGTWTIDADGQYAAVYLRSGHPLIGTPVPAGPVDLTGIASQYDPSPPFTSGYQLLPRGLGDITASSAIGIIPPVNQSALTSSGFTLSWQTNMDGSSEVFYGTSPAMGSLAGNMVPATTHTVEFNSLQPATFYYAQAFSVAGNDTAFAPVRIYSTASASAGTIKVYFTKSVDTSVSSGIDAIPLYQAMDDTIKAYIDRAQYTLDVAMYNTNSTALVAAVNDAVGRGVRVRWIAEGSNANSALDNLSSAVPVLYRTDNEGSGMHNKFFVIDADHPDLATVMGGSCNWTTQSMFDDYNNIVFIRDQALARCYLREFEEMWGGSGDQPNAALSHFGENKTDNTPHLFNVGGISVESYFSPTDGTTAQIVQAINNAQQSVRFAMFEFTQNDIGDAVLDAHDRPGMLVKGDMENIDSPGTEYEWLTSHGVEVFSHADEPGLLHHKYAIIDAGGAEPLVLTGSHNWTSSAEEVNDENTLIIHDASIANQFLQEWTARHSAVAAVDEHSAPGHLRAWPVPARDRITVEPPKAYGHAEVMLLDALGRTVLRTRINGRAVIDLANVPAGVYTIACSGPYGRITRTVSVVR